MWLQYFCTSCLETVLCVFNLLGSTEWKQRCVYVSDCVFVSTWKTLGADTRQAKAEDSVAPNIPAVMRGAKADTMLID